MALGLGISIKPAYDQAIAAIFLTALAREEHALRSCGRITQVAISRTAKDGPLCIRADSVADGELHRLSLQVFSTVKISAADDDFARAITQAQSIYNNPWFDPHRHRYGFIVGDVSIDRFAAFKTILQEARSSANGEDYISRFVPGGRTSWSAIVLRTELLPILCYPTPDQERGFYSNFFARHISGPEMSGPRFHRIAESLGEWSGAPSLGRSFALELCQWTGTRNRSVKVWNRAALLRELDTLKSHLRGNIC